MHDALVKNGDNAGMDDACSGAGFASEAGDEVGGLCQVRMHDFQGDGTVQSLIVRDVNSCHPAARKFAVDAVALVDEHPDERVSHCFVGIRRWRVRF